MAKKIKDDKYWEEFGKKVGKKFGKSNVKHYSCGCKGSSFALIILLIGLYWIAKDMGWINPQISIWAVLLVVLGFYWIVKPFFRRK